MPDEQAHDLIRLLGRPAVDQGRFVQGAAEIDEGLLTIQLGRQASDLGDHCVEIGTLELASESGTESLGDVVDVRPEQVDLLGDAAQLV